MKFLPAILLALVCSLAQAAPATYHVRTDGGLATECNGLTNASKASAKGTLACAWQNPLVALPPGGKALFSGGDTLIVHNGAYQIGLGAPGAEKCSKDFPWDCFPAPIPSGPDSAHPTQVLGEAYASCKAKRPVLWGTQRATMVLNLNGTSNAKVACMEITDHSPCVVFHSGTLKCERDRYPYGDWADSGIKASDSTSVTLDYLNIHGLANQGVQAGRLKDWTVTNTRIAANGWAGWNGDLGDSPSQNYFISSNSGTMRFSNWVVEDNGCGETYPEKKPVGCWSQEAGGYGDGVGTGKTGGDWIIEDSVFRRNTSDGLDLLYHENGGTITLNRVRAVNNAGNQIKLKGNTKVSSSIVIGNCSWFVGQPQTYWVDTCRALGDALVLITNGPNDVMSVANSTLLSAGNTVITAGTRDGTSPGKIVLRNNILFGWPFALDPDSQSADTYYERVTLDESYSIKQNLRNAICKTPNTICGDAGMMQTDRSKGIIVRLSATSQARNSGLSYNVDSLVPTTDYISNPRGADGTVDRGAYEMTN